MRYYTIAQNKKIITERKALFMKIAPIFSIISLSVMIYSTDLFARNKCIYQVNKADEFTGKVTKTTSATLSKSWKIFFSKADTVCGISLYILMAGEINTAINQGDSLFIKLKNNEFIKLAAAGSVPPRTYVAGSGAYASVVSDFAPMYTCTKEDLDKISLNPVTVVRVFIGQQFMEVTIKEKDGVKISKAAGCVLE
jgi:hypothetical protein